MGVSTSFTQTPSTFQEMSGEQQSIDYHQNDVVPLFQGDAFAHITDNQKLVHNVNCADFFCCFYALSISPSESIKMVQIEILCVKIFKMEQSWLLTVLLVSRNQHVVFMCKSYPQEELNGLEEHHSASSESINLLFPLAFLPRCEYFMLIRVCCCVYTGSKQLLLTKMFKCQAFINNQHI